MIWGCDVDTNTALGGREGLQTSRPSARQPASPVVGDGRCQWNLHHAGGMFFFSILEGNNKRTKGIQYRYVM